MKVKVSQTTLDNYIRAKVSLLRRPDSVFITTVLYALEHVWDDTIPTACVDGVTMSINPVYFDSLTHEVRQSLLAHETWHIIFNHLVRGEGLNPFIYNMAGDYIINNQLKDTGFTLGKGWLHDRKYHDMTTQDVYDILIKNSPENTPKNPQAGDIKPLNSQSKDAGKTKQDIKEIISRAYTARAMAKDSDSKSAGKLPGEVEILIEEYLNPKLPWQVILQNYMNEYDKDDYSFQRPNKRFMPDFYLPSLYSESMAEIALAFDTSCSVTNQELKQYLTETDDIINRLQPLRVTVAAFDHCLQDVTVLEKGDPVSKVKLTGRGGTSLFPVFDYYKQNPPTVLIVFSDLECTPIPEIDKPDFDVIWICVNNEDADTNFGKLIHVDLSHE